MQCTNNLKQLGLALQNYHDTNNCLPGYGFGGTRCFDYTPYIGMLPFFEQQGRYELYAAGNSNGVWELEPFHDSPANEGVLSTIVCPSDAMALKGYTESGFAKPFTTCNYRFSHADMINGRGWWSDCRSNNANCPHNNRSVFTMKYMGRSSGTGTGYCPPLAAVTDGTSNTIFMSERCANPRGRYTSDSDPMIRTGVAYADTWNSNPKSACMSLVGNNGQYVSTATTYAGSGSLYGMYYPNFTVFHTIMPPNGPSCAKGINNTDIMTATSYHSGGVNGLFADGSIHFVSDTIDAGDLSVSAVNSKTGTGSRSPSGASPYGVWGAMGSINGGESNSSL